MSTKLVRPRAESGVDSISETTPACGRQGRFARATGHNRGTPPSEPTPCWGTIRFEFTVTKQGVLHGCQ